MSTVTYDDKTWVAIKKEWLAGQISITEIARHYGPTRAAIRKKAKKEQWPTRGSLAEEVRREINTALVTGEVSEVPPEVPPEEQADAIAGAAQRGLTVINTHKGYLKRLMAQCGVTLDELEEIERIKLEFLLRKGLKERKTMMSMAVQARLDGIDTLSKVFARVIPLQRQAFSLDSERGEVQSIRYVAPEYKKPKGTGLSEDEWDKE